MMTELPDWIGESAAEQAEKDALRVCRREDKHHPNYCDCHVDDLIKEIRRCRVLLIARGVDPDAES